MSILIDGHVHIHPEFVCDDFFSAAFDNFQVATSGINNNANYQYVLALTEGGGSNVFKSLSEQALDNEISSTEPNSTNSIRFYKTKEPDSLLVRRGRQSIILVAGRQIVSKDNIEVLSLFNSTFFEDKHFPLVSLTHEVSGSGGIVVVPWGVGKWLGARGHLVASLITSNPHFPLFFADNGNRPTLWPEPFLLKKARQAGFSILSGSDPLPITSHTMRPASFGTMLTGAMLSLDTPAMSLKRLLLTQQNEDLEFKTFGHRTGPFSFVFDQLRINIRNRLPSSLACL